jgi:hypothetical protein
MRCGLATSRCAPTAARLAMPSSLRGSGVEPGGRAPAMVLRAAVCVKEKET